MITIEYTTTLNEAKHRQFVSWEHFEKFILDECDMTNTIFPLKSFDRMDFNHMNFKLVLYKNNETYYVTKLDEDELIHYSDGRLTYGRTHISDYLNTFIVNLEKSINEKIEKLNFA